MKTRILLLTIALMCIGLTSYGQVSVGKYGSPNKVSIGQKVSKSLIISYFGTPLSYRPYFDDDEYEAQVEPYSYKDFWLLCVDYKLYTFGVKSPDYVVTINNRFTFRVGESYSKVLTEILKSGEGKIKVFGNLTSVHLKVPGKDGVYSIEAQLDLSKDAKGLIDDISWYVVE